MDRVYSIHFLVDHNTKEGMRDSDSLSDLLNIHPPETGSLNGLELYTSTWS